MPSKSNELKKCNKFSAARISLNSKGSTEAMEKIDTSSCWQVTSDVSLRQAEKISLFK